MNYSNINEYDPINAKVFSVSEINRLVKEVLHSKFSQVRIKGEISGYSSYSSGHWYFKLKDKNAQVDCVMFAGKNRRVNWQPSDGDLVEIECQVSLYETNGKYQLIVDSLQKAGLGMLFEKYIQLKNQLEKDGLFDEALKKTIPKLPTSIGVITSPDGAVLKDVMTTLLRRNKSVSIIIYPTLVQGEYSSKLISDAIHKANVRKEVDTIIVCRGGGSIEDLWPFNTESVAHAIYNSNIPIISAIGHETDFTIADFVADIRAPTPTAAAELISDGLSEVTDTIQFYSEKMVRLLNDKINHALIKIDFLEKRLISPLRKIKDQRDLLVVIKKRIDLNMLVKIKHYKYKLSLINTNFTIPKKAVKEYLLGLKNISIRLNTNIKSQFKNYYAKIEIMEQNLSQLNPKSILARGYSIVKNIDKKIINDSQNIKVNDSIDITFYNGNVSAKITNKNLKD